MSIKIGKTGTVRLTDKDLERLRDEMFIRDKHLCQFRGSMGDICGKWLRKERGFYNSGHMAHIRGKRNNGDDLSNVRLLCQFHHSVVEHTYGKDGQKPCPSKSRVN